MIDVCAINRLVDEIDMEKLRQTPDSAIWELLDRCQRALVEVSTEINFIHILKDKICDLESCCDDLESTISDFKNNTMRLE